jgi:hypothetical protein
MARWGKSCTYLAPTLTLSQNKPKRDSTWPTSPRSSIINQASNWASSLRSTIKCVQNDFWAPWYVWRKQSTYFASGFELSSNELNQASTWASSPWSTIGCVQNDFWANSMFGANPTPILHRHQHYPKGPKQDSTWPRSPISTIRCVQNDFWGCSTFGTNHAPILLQD